MQCQSGIIGMIRIIVQFIIKWSPIEHHLAYSLQMLGSVNLNQVDEPSRIGINDIVNSE